MVNSDIGILSRTTGFKSRFVLWFVCCCFPSFFYPFIFFPSFFFLPTNLLQYSWFHPCLEQVPHIHATSGFIPMGSTRFHLNFQKTKFQVAQILLNIPVGLLLMFAIRSLATNCSPPPPPPPPLSTLPWCYDIGEGKRQNNGKNWKI